VRARTLRGIVRQIRRCPDCRRNPAVFFGDRLGVCAAHWEMYAEVLTFEGGQLSYTLEA